MRTLRASFQAVYLPSVGCVALRAACGSLPGQRPLARVLRHSPLIPPIKIFLTGATGFIGRHFLRAALSAGHEIVALRHPGSRSAVPIPDSDRLTWFDGDLNSFFSDPSAFNFQLSTCSSSALVHLAAAGVAHAEQSWDNCFRVNVEQSLCLWRQAAAHGVRRLIVCGSCFEYGRAAERYDFVPADAPLEPTGPYHSSKAAASMAAYGLAVEQNLDLAILRPFHVFGEGEHPDRLWPSLRKAALAGEDFPMSPGEQVRDFVPVEQVANAFLRAVSLPPSAFHFRPSTFSSSPLVANIGTGRPQTLRAFAEHWWEKWGAKGKLLPGSIPYRENEVMRYVPEVSPLFLN